MGLLWDVVEDTITAVPRYNLFGESRGMQQGPNLKDMTLEQMREHDISRLVLLRLSAQTYDKLANILGPLMFTCKVLTSRACKLAGVDDMELDLRKRDPEFVEVCLSFVAALRRVDRIIPFERLNESQQHEIWVYRPLWFYFR